jgi:hypothetical protein
MGWLVEKDENREEHVSQIVHKGLEDSVLSKKLQEAGW